jgi:hypothetical protein
MHANAHIKTDKGRRMRSDCASVRDAPPVANSATRKKAKIQKAGAGLLVKRDEGKSGLVKI